MSETKFKLLHDGPLDTFTARNLAWQELAAGEVATNTIASPTLKDRINQLPAPAKLPLAVGFALLLFYASFFIAQTFM